MQVSNTDLATSYRIIAVKEDEHRAMLAELHHGWEDRVEYWHIHDIDFAKPQDALPELEVKLGLLLEQIEAEEKAAK